MLDLQICFQGDDLPRAIEKTWVRPCDLFYDFSFACMYVYIISIMTSMTIENRAL